MHPLIPYGTTSSETPLIRVKSPQKVQIHFLGGFCSALPKKNNQKTGNFATIYPLLGD